MAGGIAWFTGLSGAGKTTLATAVARRVQLARPIEVLDGDKLREFVSTGLGFSRQDRDTNVQRIAYIARLLANHGVLVFVAAISPYAETRADLRRRSEEAGHPFVEFYVNAPLDTVVARDVKGLYKRALAGELAHFTGVSDPYESPLAPDLELHTDRDSQRVCEEQILAVLAARGLAT
ncbi:MAG: cysC [Deltaproteobacteria bacterium]|nr:cysC [Deltaproteobacteria bacterium]